MLEELHASGLNINQSLTKWYSESSYTIPGNAAPLKPYTPNVVHHIVGAYNAKGPHPTSIKPLFSDEEEKNIFFTEPVMPSLIHGSQLEKTLVCFNASKPNIPDVKILSSSMEKGALKRSRNDDQEPENKSPKVPHGKLPAYTPL